VVVCFVDIGGIVGRHCLNFLLKRKLHNYPRLGINIHSPDEAPMIYQKFQL